VRPEVVAVAVEVVVVVWGEMTAIAWTEVEQLWAWLRQNQACTTRLLPPLINQKSDVPSAAYIWVLFFTTLPTSVTCLALCAAAVLTCRVDLPMPSALLLMHEYACMGDVRMHTFC
jgi:hypothetical protein